MNLPGVCIACRVPVVWHGEFWWEGLNHHRCNRKAIPVCESWMPHAKEFCARRRGHSNDHRTRYALDNDARARRAS